MKTILVPLDGSRQADQVLPHVAYLARTLKARVCLLRVLPDLYDGVPALHDVVASYGVGEGMLVQAPAQPSLDARRREAEDEELSALIELRAQGLEAELEVHVGHPAEIIVETATAKQVALIAMATHGYSGLRRWALGSVTDKVIHTAPMPVYVVRGVVADAVQAPQLRRLLVPLDGSAFSRQALPLATELAVASGAELILLHVVTAVVNLAYADPFLGGSFAGLTAEASKELADRAFAELQTLAQQIHAQHGVTVRCVVGLGLAPDVIIDETETREADLVVMATHGYSGLRRWALGSVTDKVLHAGRTPLLLVRASEAEADAAAPSEAGQS